MARCKYGKLKNPSKGRRCKKRRSRGGKGRARRGAPKCRYGKLKHPRGRRICRRRAR